ncbi:MFS transporter [Paenibacillus sp. P25]|nr:MFS transporter [Paenibacillus sp. P25]
MRAVNQQTTEKNIPAWLTILLAAACGIIVANLYYAQPLVGLISSSIGLSAGSAGFIVTLTQIGYVVGLLFVVPLGDLVENRRLIVVSLFLTAIALAGAAIAKHAVLFLAASLVIGVGSVATQVLVPFASYLAAESSRGRVVGNVMSGLLLGIMLSRPLASLMADFFSWHAIFALSAAAVVILAIVLSKVLPARKPAANTTYSALLGSMWHLLRTTPVLRRRAIYHACVFATFSLFWTTAPLLLSGPVFHFSQKAIALFALVGVAGAVAAPVAGRLADRGWTRPATGIALATVILSVFFAASGPDRFACRNRCSSLISDLIGRRGIRKSCARTTRDLFVGTGNSQSSERAFHGYFLLWRSHRIRRRGMGVQFGGWGTALWIGITFPIMAILYFATEKKS